MNYQKDKPIIGVIGRIYENKIVINDEIRYAILKSGGIPHLILPNQLEYKKKLTKKEKEEVKHIVHNIDGLILQGGTKWFYFDEYIYIESLIRDIPILGICLGMQMMCKVDVDVMYGDNTKKNETIINHNQTKRYVHKVKILANTKLKSIIKRRKIKVNSRHNYHVNKIKNLKISAYSTDGLIEGVEYTNKRFVIGVEWHPETTYNKDIYSKRLFNAFISECKKNRQL